MGETQPKSQAQTLARRRVRKITTALSLSHQLPLTNRPPELPPRTADETRTQTRTGELRWPAVGTAPARPTRFTAGMRADANSAAYSLAPRKLSGVPEVPADVAVTVHFDDGKSGNGPGASHV